jgi:hypothetical protein
MSWKLSKAAIQLREQIDDNYPERDKRSDGSIGDFRHSKTVSDHNPDSNGWVRALDIDANLNAHKSEMAYLANQLRQNARRDKRISYIIYNSKMASPKSLWKWVKYRGINPHKSHIHISFKKKADTDGRFFNIPMLGGSL